MHDTKKPKSFPRNNLGEFLGDWHRKCLRRDCSIHFLLLQDTIMKTTTPLWKRILGLATLSGVGLLAMNQSADASGLLIADGGFGGVLEIKDHDVSVTVNNGIAVTEVHQIFRNTEQRIVEALYTFPVPNGASVSNFSMIINGKEMTGEVVEKKRARQIYESYKQTKRDPGLLEQVDYKTFELRVFPIAPGAEQDIKVTYCQQLEFDHDNATYVYPLATTTRTNIDQKTRSKFAFTIDVKSEIPLVGLKSPSHEEDFVITRHSDKYTRASLEVREGDLSRDVVIHFDTERPRTGIDLITSKQNGEDGYFMLTMTAGKELEEYGAGMDYVFVVDVSGSMANDGKLMLSRRVVDSFVGGLGTDDRFEVMTFNNMPQVQFQSLRDATPEAKKQTSEFLESQRAKGGTVLRPAVLTAYKYKSDDRPLNVVILSDGMTENREQTELLKLMKEAPASTRVFCIGIGNEVNRPLLKQLAEGAGGLAAFVSQQDDFARQSQAFRRKLMRPVATNVSINVVGLETYDVTPKDLPDLFYGSPIRLFGRYKGSGPAKVAVKGEIMGQPIQQLIDINLPSSNEENPEIERMWAFHRVQGLADQMRLNGNSDSAVGEIINLCEGYSIVSEYASFIVLENDAEYKRWSINRRNATRVKRDEAARQTLKGQLEAMRNASIAGLGPQDAQDSRTAASAQSGTSPLPNSAIPNTNVANDPVPSTATDINWSSSGSGSSVRRSSGGGGAIDPITGLIAAGLAGAAAWAARRDKKPV
jgi:Ca-activated chloride channel homolog